MKKILTVVCVGFGLIACSVASQGATNSTKRATRQGSNSVLAEIDINRVPWKDIPLTNSLGERFEYYIHERLDERSIRTFHPLNNMSRLLTARDQIDLDERRAAIGKKFVQKTLEHGIREVIKGVPLVYRVAHQDSFVARLVRDSIGNTEEEDFDQNSYTTNDLSRWEAVAGTEDYPLTNRLSLWSRLAKDIQPRYGLRWSYAYLTLKFVRHERTFLFADLRYHYGEARTGDVKETDMEALISVPVVGRTFFTAGLIQNIDPPNWDRRWAFRITQKIDGGKIFGGVAIRETSSDDPVRYVFGFERPW